MVDSKKIDALINSNMKYGIGRFQMLPSYLVEMNFTRAAIILDAAIVSSSYVAAVVHECEKVLEKCEVLTYVLHGEPTYDYLDNCAGRIRHHPDIEVIVGVGGGSVIDTAKGIAILMKNEGTAITYRGFPKGLNRPLPIIAVPTTAGSGSEVTYNAVFIDTKENKKLGINTMMNFPTLSILDPKLIASCPQAVLASVGMDALTHGLESFVSKKATVISRMFSTQALKLLFVNLEKVIDAPGDLNILGNIQIGAYLAGIALINSSAGPAGALSYLLGTWYKVPHGIAGAVFLPYIHNFNFQNEYHEYSAIYDAIYPVEAPKKSPEEKARLIIDKLFFLNKKLGIKERLSSYGVDKDGLKRFENEAAVNLKSAFDFNPVQIKAADLKNLLENIF